MPKHHRGAATKQTGLRRPQPEGRQGFADAGSLAHGLSGLLPGAARTLFLAMGHRERLRADIQKVMKNTLSMMTDDTKKTRLSRFA